MSAAFTPGPWIAEGSCVRNEREEHRFTCGLTRTAYASREEMQANARLIAAAPDMYDVLANIIANAALIADPAMGECADCYAVPIDDIRAAEAAFAKARGQ